MVITATIETIGRWGVLFNTFVLRVWVQVNISSGGLWLHRVDICKKTHICSPM